MSDGGNTASMHDAVVVTAQLGRAPREPWCVSVRCRHGFPSVIESPSVLADGSRFPTMYWLTCPFLADEASRRESAGEGARWNERIEGDADLRQRILVADAELRSRRHGVSGSDACEGVGVAGQRDPRVVKCLHARIACALVGIADPVGEAIRAAVGDLCDDVRCAEWIGETAGAV